MHDEASLALVAHGVGVLLSCPPNYVGLVALLRKPPLLMFATLRTPGGF